MTQLQVEAAPESVGMASDRLARIGTHFQKYIEDGRLTGWQISVARHGKVVYHALAGQRDVAAGKPVEADTIWRIYSMTKPIVAVLALQLWEEGAFELSTPLHRFIPAFRDTKVWRSGTVEAPELEPLAAPIRLWHLFTHMSGLTYGFMRSHPVDSLYRRMLRVSDNFLAEQLLLLCSTTLGHDSLSTGRTIRFLLKNQLRTLPDAPAWVDGSGLSRLNLVTPRTFTGLLLRLHQEVPEPRLLSLLAAGGGQGTLRKRYHDAAGPWFWGKTGTLTHNVNICGYVRTKSGRLVAVSFFNNSFPGDDQPVRNEMERLLREVRDRL